ncbi:hypothetical protein [Caudoviricetes sp.]|nr:hypothetical protein [Caudoviricetes sp.]
MSSSDTTIDQLLYRPTYKTRVVLSKSSYQKPNQFKPRKIEVRDFYLDFRDVQWKGQIANVEYELFCMLISDWMKRYKWTKEQALDEFFEILV